VVLNVICIMQIYCLDAPGDGVRQAAADGEIRVC
jgi:hypothetical protein